MRLAQNGRKKRRFEEKRAWKSHAWRMLGSMQKHFLAAALFLSMASAAFAGSYRVTYTHRGLIHGFWWHLTRQNGFVCISGPGSGRRPGAPFAPFHSPLQIISG
jgi:hypothetical protein